LQQSSGIARRIFGFCQLLPPRAPLLLC